jgi:putative transposase
MRRLPEELRRLVEGLALRPPAPSTAHMHRVVAEVAKNQGWPVSSYATVHAIVRSIDPAMRTLALHGESVTGRCST